MIPDPVATLFTNFRLLPLRQALRLPIILAWGSRLFGSKGSILIEGPVQLGMIRIGFGNVGIFPRRAAIIRNQGRIIFRGACHLGHGVRIENGGYLEFGNDFHVTAESRFWCSESMVFGNGVLISWDCLFMDTDGPHQIYINGIKQKKSVPVIIGDRVWIGCRVTCLKGSGIASDSVVGACSLVNSVHAETHVLLAGVPATVRRRSIRWTK